MKIGVSAFTGAGSVITKDVEDDALAVTRGSQNVVPGWTSRRQKSKGND